MVMKRVSFVSAAAVSISVAVGCDGSEATYLAVTNGYPVPAANDAGEDAAPPGTFASTTIVKAWYQSTLLLDNVAPGHDSQVHLVAPGTDYVYALVAPGWSPDLDAGAPSLLIPVITSSKINIAKGDTRAVLLSDSTVRGLCQGSPRLTQDEYEVITGRIFPGDPTPAYDPAACGKTPALGADGGTDAAGAQSDAGPPPVDAAGG